MPVAPTTTAIGVPSTCVLSNGSWVRVRARVRVEARARVRVRVRVSEG